MDGSVELLVEVLGLGAALCSGWAGVGYWECEESCILVEMIYG